MTRINTKGKLRDKKMRNQRDKKMRNQRDFAFKSKE